jgi:hypothetical protein
MVNSEFQISAQFSFEMTGGLAEIIIIILIVVQTMCPISKTLSGG